MMTFYKRINKQENGSGSGNNLAIYLFRRTHRRRVAKHNSCGACGEPLSPAIYMVEE